VEAALSPKDVTSTGIRCLTPDAEKLTVMSPQPGFAACN
jgi:hypothetical protein